jgi:hypothetical protein
LRAGRLTLTYDELARLTAVAEPGERHWQHRSHLAWK